MLIDARSVGPLLAQVALLLLPIVVTIGIRRVVLQSHEAEQKTVWAAYQTLSRFILIAAVASWWMTWDVRGRPNLKSIIVSRWPDMGNTSVAESLLFWVSPTVSLGIFLLLCYMIETRIFGLQWTITNAFRQAWWKLVSFVIPLLLVPAGKGHLTNAYGMSNAIALTDNLGKYLTKAQLEFVVAHELAHVKLKHARKHSLLMFAVFSITALLLFSFPQRALPFRPLIQLIAMIGPLVALYYWSRRFEYSADGEALDFTGNPEVAIWALANVHRSRESPVACRRLAELFATHPTIAQRVHAIAIGGNMSFDRLTEILKETGIVGIHGFRAQSK